MKTKSLSIGFIIYFISSLVSFSQNVDNKDIKQESTIRHNVSDSLNSEIINSKDSVKTDFVSSKDTLSYKTLNYQQDTTKNKRPASSSMLKDNIDLNSTDSTIYSIDGKKVFLFGEASIKYEDIELEADYIEIDMEHNIIYAEGVKDSVGNITGEPIFTQGGEAIQTKSITYNVKTQRAFIKGLYTEQEEGYLHSESTKKEADNTINLHKGKYTTCELDHPHFYLSLSRGKVIPGKAIVASYSYLVIEDVPLFPLMVPFGFFPTTKEQASGFIIPKFGEENNRGFYLRNGGGGLCCFFRSSFK